MTPTPEGLKPLAARLPRLGFGAAPIGNLYAPVSDGQAFEAVAEALAARPRQREADFILWNVYCRADQRSGE